MPANDGSLARALINAGMPAAVAQQVDLALADDTVGTIKLGPTNVLTQQHTQVVAPADTNENTLYSFTLPGGTLGPNDTLIVDMLGQHTNGANSKTWRIKFGASPIYSSGHTTSALVHFVKPISNRGSLTQQIAPPNTMSGPGNTSTAAAITPNIDTTQDQVISITAQKAVGTDAMSLESVVIFLRRAAT